MDISVIWVSLLSPFFKEIQVTSQIFRSHFEFTSAYNMSHWCITTSLNLNAEVNRMVFKETMIWSSKLWNVFIDRIIGYTEDNTFKTSSF